MVPGFTTLSSLTYVDKSYSIVTIMLYRIRTDYFQPDQNDGGLFLDAFIDEGGLEHVAYDGGLFLDAFIDEGGLEHVAYRKRTEHYIVLVMLGGRLQWVRVR